MCLKLYYSLFLIINVISVNFVSNDDSIYDTKDEKPLPRNNTWISYFGDLSIKLKLYYDNYLFSLHNKNRTSVETFIKKTFSSTSLTFRHSEIQKVAKINFWIQSIELFNENDFLNKHYSQKYLDYFCKNTQNSHFNILYGLFTGLDLLSESKGKNGSKSTQGIAKTGSICKAKACFLVEGKYYKAAIVSAHEIGHIFGVPHDNSEHLNLMHTGTDRGRSIWSQQNIKYLRQSLNNLTKSSKWCLDYSKDTNIDILTVDINEQCRQMFGPEFQVYHQMGQLYGSICQQFWCKSGPFVMRGHMALENTECAGHNSYCFAGQCHKRLNKSTNN